MGLSQMNPVALLRLLAQHYQGAPQPTAAPLPDQLDPEHPFYSAQATAQAPQDAFPGIFRMVEPIRSSVGGAITPPPPVNDAYYAGIIGQNLVPDPRNALVPAEGWAQHPNLSGVISRARLVAAALQQNKSPEQAVIDFDTREQQLPGARFGAGLEALKGLDALRHTRVTEDAAAANEGRLNRLNDAQINNYQAEAYARTHPLSTYQPKQGTIAGQPATAFFDPQRMKFFDAAGNDITDKFQLGAEGSDAQWSRYTELYRKVHDGTATPQDKVELEGLSQYRQMGVPSIVNGVGPEGPGIFRVPKTGGAATAIPGLSPLRESLTGSQSLDANNKLGALQLTDQLVTRILTNQKVADNLISAGKIKLATDPHTGELLVSQLTNLTPQEAQFAADWQSLAEHINTLRAPLGATGFRGAEGWGALQAQRGNLLANPAITKGVLTNTQTALRRLIGNYQKALGSPDAGSAPAQSAPAPSNPSHDPLGVL